MKSLHPRSILALFCGCILFLACGKQQSDTATEGASSVSESFVTQTIDSLLARHGEALRPRIESGVRQVAELWRESDGTNEEFALFCRDHFIADQGELDATFARFEHNLMLINGYLTELRRDLSIPLQLDAGPMLAIDYRFGEFAPEVHATDDLFGTKIAFVALLNFPLSTLQQRLDNGAQWTRRQWAEARLVQRFSSRVTADAQQQATTAYTTADNYISSYNIHMGRLLNAKGERLFPDDLVLISHWGLRDELKAQYDNEGGLERQRMILRVMDRIVKQEIPSQVIDNPGVDWRVDDNTVAPTGAVAKDFRAAEREADTRYAMWLKTFKGEQAIDPHVKDNPTHIARRFNSDREIPEETVEQLLTSILTAPQVKRVAQLIRTRLGRELEPFDIWYTGFKSRPPVSEQELDKLLSRKYPNVQAFERDIPVILGKLGFDPGMATAIAGAIGVDASRGAGHAMGAGRVTDKARLRTRVPAGGMKYKGYNIAIHELGHNVEQVLSYRYIDHTLLRGVPNTAFTEGFAFVFQSRDLDLLGFKQQDASREALNTLDVLWSTYEIAGVALIDMRAWRWLYEHPECSAEQFREAVLSIAKEVWNAYYAPVLGMKDVPLLAIYSHMVDAGLYTPDYPLGHIIAFQIEQYLQGKNLAKEMQRMCAIGSVSPDLWMKTAVGAPISTKPMLEAADKALALQ